MTDQPKATPKKRAKKPPVDKTPRGDLQVLEDTIFEQARQLIAALDSIEQEHGADPTFGMITSHHGEGRGFDWGELTINVSLAPHADGTLLVMIYCDSFALRTYGIGKVAKAAVSRLGEVRMSWNDEPDGRGGSYVLNRAAPSTFCRAITNCRTLVDVFAPTKAERALFALWDSTFKAHLAKVRG